MDRFFNRSINSDSKIGEKRSKLSKLNQTQNRRRYVNFENGSHLICSLSFNNLELSVFITFKMTDISSENQEFVNSLIGNTSRKNQCKVHNILQNIWCARLINFKSTWQCLCSNSKL